MSDSQRRGKIARLPRDIRDQLNLRLDDGLEAAEILPWLNALPEVRQVLARFFRGSPVTSQNLSAWRSGGFQEWLFHQRFLDTAIHMRQYVDELEDALNINSLGARRTLADCMITQLSIRFAAFFARWDGVALSPETGALLKIGNFIIKLQRAACQAERQALELPRLRREAELEDLKEREINEAFIRHCEENVREDGTVPSLSEIERSRKTRPAETAAQ